MPCLRRVPTLVGIDCKSATPINRESAISRARQSESAPSKENSKKDEMRTQLFNEGDHVRIRSSNDVLGWLQGVKGRISTVSTMGHTFMYSVRFDVPKRGRMAAAGIMQQKLDKA